MNAQIYAGLTRFDRQRFLKGESNSKLDEIMARVSYELQQSPADMVSQWRKRQVVEARQIAMVLIFENTDMTLLQIGKYFGGRDHSTVIYAKNTFYDLYETDKLFKIKVDNIRGKLSFINV